jgi:filamentous hemagglutinin family protein
VFSPGVTWARVFYSSSSSEVSAPGSTELPTGGSFSSGTGSISTDEERHYMTVTQNSTKGTVEWDKFNIGAKGTVDFQNGSSGVTLNRIGDTGLSKIWGTLTSEGTIYLINHNGFVFGKDSSAQVGSLVVSSLDITDDNFDNGVWAFSSEDAHTGAEYEAGDVVNNGSITSTRAGRIMILGNSVTNNGALSADGGEVVLGAASSFAMRELVSSETNKLVVTDGDNDFDNDGDEDDTLTALTGQAVNTSKGVILADVGEVGIYGRIIRQNGQIRAVSTLERGSVIELVATDAITTGTGSLIDSSVHNDTDRDGNYTDSDGNFICKNGDCKGKEYDEDDNITTDDPFAHRELTISTLDEEVYAIDIELAGDITMPSGKLDIYAGEGGNIYIQDGADIDLSGCWSTKDTEDQVISATLNSEELRDEQEQQGGALQGETIYFLLRKGTNIGNVSNYITSRSQSAYEQASKGGDLNLYAGNGTVTIADGAGIDISGGGITYEAGFVETSILVDSDGDVHDISEAPDYLEYTDVINSGDKEYIDRYRQRVPEYSVGESAGTLKINASRAVFEGRLRAGATVGLYQVNAEELTDDLGYQKTDETAIPVFGTLTIGSTNQTAGWDTRINDINRIVIKENTSTGDPGDDTWLSGDLLSNSGLGTVKLYANEGIFIEEGASINLYYGEFIAVSRTIYVAGSIIVPSGDISLTTKANYTSNASDPDNYVYVGPERIELASTGILSVAGERIDNSDKTDPVRNYACLDAGTITLKDDNKYGQGVVARAGSEINVDGGWFLNKKSELIGAGDAGSLHIYGDTIILDGAVSGLSMDGYKGGTITLNANWVEIVTSGSANRAASFNSDQNIPDSAAGYLVLDDDYLSDTGFTNISIAATYDLTVERGVSLAPSQIKRLYHWLDGFTEITRDLDYIGVSSISLSTGQYWVSDTYNDDSYDEYLSNTAVLTINKNTSLEVTPGGSISIYGKGGMDISGTYTAMAGSISLETDGGVLLVNPGTGFYAGGYNMDTQETINDDDIFWDLMDGGEISFDALGVLVLSPGVVVDVSGSQAVLMYKAGDRAGSLESYWGAASPGSVSVTYGAFINDAYTTTLDASFIATKSLSTLYGGAFSLSSYMALIIDDDFLSQLDEAGFDSLNLLSELSIDFTTTLSIEMARGIGIYTPLITAENGNEIFLTSPWVRILNTYESSYKWGGLDSDLDITTGGTLVVNADYIDIKGAVQATGFEALTLNAGRYIRLTDTYYKPKSGNGDFWSGLFYVDGDLTLASSCTYVTTGSDFIFASDSDIYTQSSGSAGMDTIYSAYGQLTVAADNIHHYGVLAAPNGQIFLDAEETVYLASGSELSVAGSGVAVNYGEMDDDNLKWTTDYAQKYDSEASDTVISSTDDLKEKLITIEGSTVIAMDGSVINIEGGGTVYGYTFMAGQKGSYDRLTMDGVYVIVPYNANLPGDAVYLEGNDLIEEGLYSLLSEEYAFLSGAVVIESAGSANGHVAVSASEEGYAQIRGYEADALTGYHASEASLYTVRKAVDVMAEGEYETVSLVTGDAGTLTVDSSTTVLNADVYAAALSSDYDSGAINLTAEHIIITSTAESIISSSFSIESNLASLLSDYEGTLYISDDFLSAGGFGSITLSSEGSSDDEAYTITFESGTSVNIENLSLEAEDDIILESGAFIASTGDEGYINIFSETGSLVLNANAAISSSYYLGIETQGIEGDQGAISTGSILALTADSLYLVDNSYGLSENAFVVDSDLWKSFASMDQVILTGNDVLGFYGIISLDTTRITLDTPMLAALSQGTHVTIEADQATIHNASDATGTDDYDFDARFNLTAGSIGIGNGEVQISGFDTVAMSAAENITFIGQGALATGDADLTLAAAAVTGSYTWIDAEPETENEPEYEYEAVDFTVDAGNGALTITSNGNTAENNGNIRGMLTFTADTIKSSGTILLSSGVVYLSATGNGDGIYMENGAVIDVSGSGDEDRSYDGGTVFYESESNIVLASGSVTDVSAGCGYSDAGTIYIDNPEGTATINGTLQGTAPGGSGASFLMDTGTLSSHTSEVDGLTWQNLSALTQILSSGSFTNDIGLRLRNGNALLDSTVSVVARTFKLSLDDGSIRIHGGLDENHNGDATIDASWEDGGGTIELYASGDIFIKNALLSAQGTGVNADGGQIIINPGIIESDPGSLTITDSIIDLSGTGDDGSIYLRALAVDIDTRDDDGNTIYSIPVPISLTGNILRGIASLTVEPVMVDSDTTATVDYNNAEDWYDWMSDYMTSSESDIKDSLLKNNTADVAVTLVTGIEVQRAGNLTIKELIDDGNEDYPLDLSNWRFGKEEVVDADGRVVVDEDGKVVTVGLPAVLTFKATGDVTITNDIIDAPTNVVDISADTVQSSTTIKIAAGASLTNPDTLALSNDGAGLTINDGVMIYTESGDITFASGGDTMIGSAPGVNTISLNDDTNYMNANPLSYNIGSYAGTVTGYTGRDLIIAGGVIQTAVSDITLHVARDLILQKNGNGVLGTIRTVGDVPEISSGYGVTIDQQLFTNAYHDGGSITITAQGDVVSRSDNYREDEGDTLEGLNQDAWDAALYTYEFDDDGAWLGRNDGVFAWGACYNTNYSVKKSGDSVTQGIATMGGGNITITAGGDVLAQAGAFDEGDVAISAGGDINGVFANVEGDLNLFAMGSVGNISGDQVIEACDTRVAVVSQGNIDLSGVVNPTFSSDYFADSYYLSYSQDTSAALSSVLGSVYIGGDVSLDDYLHVGNNGGMANLMPATLTITAPQDIVLSGIMYLSPSENGQLYLSAGNDITSGLSNSSASDLYGIIMGDADPESVYGYQSSFAKSRIISSAFSGTLHEEDTAGKAIIEAGNNVANIKIRIPKAAAITAGGDIINLDYTGQNLSSTDITTISAAGSIIFADDIDLGIDVADSFLGIEVGGPGLTIIQAGNNIDLANAAGINIVGNSMNTNLDSGENNLVMVAGMAQERVLAIDDVLTYVQKFLEKAKAEAVAYKDAGDEDTQDAILAAFKAYVASMFDDSGDVTGDISLVSSQIYNNSSSGAIYTLAKGEIDVGLSKVETPPILASSDAGNGGSDETGITTNGGGPISLFAGSDINVNQSRIMTSDGGNILVVSLGDVYAGTGSTVAYASSETAYEWNNDGTLTLSYVPSAFGSGIRAIEPYGSDDSADWNAAVYVFDGIIDAGEAGIGGNNVTLYASEILNVQNVSVEGSAAGFSTETDTGTSVSGLTGNSSLADNTMMDEESEAMAAAKEKLTDDGKGLDIEPRWVKVEVTGFEADEQGA